MSFKTILIIYLIPIIATAAIYFWIRRKRKLKGTSEPDSWERELRVALIVEVVLGLYIAIVTFFFTRPAEVEIEKIEFVHRENGKKLTSFYPVLYKHYKSNYTLKICTKEANKNFESRIKIHAYDAPSYYLDFEEPCEIREPKDTLSIPLKIDPAILYRQNEDSVRVKIEIYENDHLIQDSTVSIQVFGRNFYDPKTPESLVAFMDFSKNNIAIFDFTITLRNFANRIQTQRTALSQPRLNKDWLDVVALYAGLRALNIHFHSITLSDYIRYPEEFLFKNEYRNGTYCDVLVLFSTMLRTAQIPVSIVSIAGNPDEALLRLELNSDPRSPRGIQSISSMTKSFFYLDISKLSSGFVQAIETGNEKWMEYSEKNKTTVINVDTMQQVYPPVSLPKHDSFWAWSASEDVSKLINEQIATLISTMQSGAEMVTENAVRLTQAGQRIPILRQIIDLLSSKDERRQRDGVSMFDNLQTDWETQAMSQELFQVIKQRLQDNATTGYVKNLILEKLGSVGGIRTLEFFKNIKNSLSYEPSVTPALEKAMNSIIHNKGITP